jgi:hypothetical protein
VTRVSGEAERKYTTLDGVVTIEEDGSSVVVLDVIADLDPSPYVVVVVVVLSSAPAGKVASDNNAATATEARIV